MKWLGLAIAGVLATQVIGGLAIAFGQANNWPADRSVRRHPVPRAARHPGGHGHRDPARRGLFDIDVIISRALLFTLLSAGVTAVYAAIVLGIGTYAATGATRCSRSPPRSPSRWCSSRCGSGPPGLANRLVSGKRATPYQVLSDFAGGMAGQLDLGDALDRMVSLLGGTAGASRVEAWIRVGTELRPSAVWPGGSAPSATVQLNGGTAELPVPDSSARMVPVRHGDDLLGAISLSKPPSRPLTSTEDSLLQHLASQAGPGAMSTAQLTAELRATDIKPSCSPGPRAGWSRPRTPNAAGSSRTARRRPAAA